MLLFQDISAIKYCPYEQKGLFDYGMKNLLELCAVASGGAVGAVLRFIVSRSETLNSTRLALPWATLLVNIAGCFLIGLASAFLQRSDSHNAFRIFLIPGILGGFTTYSAFAFESYSLFRQENSVMACLYVFITVVLGLCAVAIGAYLVESPRISN